MVLFQADIERLIEIREYIISNLEKDLSLKSIASKFNLEQHTLCRHFAQHFQIPLHQFIKNKRLLKAHDLLTNRIMSVSEVAIAVGYRDKSTFSHAFSAKFSISPKELFRDTQNQQNSGL